MIQQGQEEIVNYYYENNGERIRTIVDKVLCSLKFYDVDEYHFYSLANEIFVNAMHDFDAKKNNNNFESYLTMVLFNKFKTEMSKINRKKRGGDKTTISLFESINDDDKGKCLLDFISDNSSNIGKNEEYTDRTMSFLNELSSIQKQICIMIGEGYSPKEIKDKLHMTDKQYMAEWNAITSYENKRKIYKDNYVEITEEAAHMNLNSVGTEDVMETYKNTSYSIASLSKQLQKGRIRDNHVLQRASGQWARFAKSELISDILRGKSLTQIIISEEIKNGLRMQWLIDGKQRCTTLDDYLHNGFSISKNIKNYLIKYQTPKTDEEGNEVVNEDGFTEIVYKECDIRGKKFSQLPDELQDIFKDRQIPVLYNMNCTKKDIADDIARFNRSRPMNKAQNGWLGLDESFAEFVDNISRMPFFSEGFKGSSYTKTNHSSGMIRRAIVEGIITSDFIQAFNKNFNTMCEFLTDEATDSNFTTFYSLIERLTEVSCEETSELFNIKDSFLWFGLFSRFSNLGIKDEKFIEFMKEFSLSLHKKEVDGITFDDLCMDTKTNTIKTTKDKTIVNKKIELLEKLMLNYLHIDKEALEDVSLLDFVKENIDIEVTEDDIEFYENILSDLIIEVDNDTKLLEERNKPSLLAIVAYSCQKDVDLDEWIIDFFKSHNTYILNQKENYLDMKNNLLRFIEKKKEEAA